MIVQELYTFKPHFFSFFQYNENNQQYSTKIMKIQVLLRGLEEIAKAFMELCFGIKKKTTQNSAMRQGG